MKTLVAILFSVMLTSCPNNNMENNQEDNNSFVSVYKGRLNGSEGVKEQYTVVTSEKELQQYIAKLNLPKEVVTAIDLSQNSYIVLVDKVRNTGGFTIEVESINNEKKTLVVNVKKTGPKPTDMVTMAIEQPFQIVKIKKTNKEIVFVTK